MEHNNGSSVLFHLQVQMGTAACEHLMIGAV